jgi:paraquat-inducible protein B
VGKVEKIGFNADLSQVVVSIRVDKDVAPFVDADSSFWLVRPELTTSGVSRLDTVLSGVFIEGLWDNVPGPLTTRFAGLKDAPLARARGRGSRCSAKMAARLPKGHRLFTAASRSASCATCA